METSINNISRTMTQRTTEVKVTQPRPVDKKDGAEPVSELPKKEKLTVLDINRAELKDGLNNALEESGKDGNEQLLADTIKNINTAFTNIKRTLQFNLDEESGRTVIKIVDTESGEEIKQIPSEELLAISRRLAEHLDQQEVVGMLLKKEV